MLPITALYAGLIGLLYIALSVLVIQRRKSAQVSLGTGDDNLLLARTRAHGNLAEYAPLALILMALTEIGGAPVWHVHLLGMPLIVGRLCHAGALLQGGMTLRIAGMMLTFASLALGALACLWIALA